MIKPMVFVMLLCSLSANGGTWQRIDHNAIRFSGDIQQGDFERLEAILSPDDRILYLDSKGGDVEVGVRLASHLLPRQLTVIVDGICASSCANYLFTAGLNKEIRRGWVGFHGNATALMAQDWHEVARKKKRRRAGYLISKFLNYMRASWLWRRLSKNTWKVRALNKLFLNALRSLIRAWVTA